MRLAGVHRLRPDLMVDTLQGFQVWEAYDGTEWKHWSVDNKWMHFMSPTNQKMQGCERIGQYAHKVQVLISSKYKETWVHIAQKVHRIQKKRNPPEEPSQKSTSRKKPGPYLRQEHHEAAQTHTYRKIMKDTVKLIWKVRARGMCRTEMLNALNSTKNACIPPPTPLEAPPTSMGRAILVNGSAPSVLPPPSPNVRLNHTTNAV